MRIGLIADTHGLLRPEAVAFLQGCDHILHAGDSCDAQTLAQVAAIAPVTAVRGNNDRGEWAKALPETELLQFHAVVVYVIHDLSEFDLDPTMAGIHVVVSGHSHQPLIRHHNGVLYVNPGSAGPRRFSLPVSIGELIIDGDQVSARTLNLLSP